MRVRAIDVALIHQRESQAVLLRQRSFNLFVTVRFLVLELVAGKPNNLESLLVILIMSFNQCEEVLFCKRSVRSNVRYQKNTGIALVVAHNPFYKVNVSHRDRPQLFGRQANLIGIFALCPRYSKTITSLRVSYNRCVPH